MTVYHYTSYQCWQVICKEGLQPYRIIKTAFKQHLGTDTVRGIWIWLHAQKGLAHRGAVLYQMTMKNVTKIVLLRVNYNESATLCTDEGELTLLHEGRIGKLVYHNYNEQARAVVVLEPILPRAIKLLATYDLMKVWKEKQ